MTQQAQTGRLPGDAAPAPLETAEAGTGIGIDNLLERLWDLLTSMKFGVVVIIAIAALGFVGTLVVQAPAGVAADAAAKADWLDQVRPKYGGWTGIMDQLQVFTLFDSVWLRGLAALLTASLIACSAHRLPGLWKSATKPHVAIGEAFFTHAPQHEFMTVRGTSEEIRERLTGVLRRHHYRVVSEDDGILHLYADKFRWGPFGTVIGHLSLVVILAGAVVGSMFGFRDTGFVVAEGSTAPVASGEGISVKLVQFQDAWYASTGSPADYASDLIVYQNDQEVARQTVRVNEPLRYNGLTFYQSFYGNAASMRVVGADGAEVYTGGVPLAWTEDSTGRRVGSFVIPGADLTVWVIGTGGSSDAVVKPGQMRVEVYKGSDGSPVAGEVIDQRKTVALAGYDFTFERETQYTGLSVARDPGTPLVWLGSGLMIAGFVLVLMFPHQRLWGRLVVRKDGRGMLSIAAAGRRDVTANTDFTDLVTDIRAAFVTPASA